MPLLTIRSAILSLVAKVLSPIPCITAGSILPWDYTLSVLQSMLVTQIAPAAISVAMVGSALLYSLGGCDELAGRLFGSARGGCIALALVHLLNYVAFQSVS